LAAAGPSDGADEGESGDLQRLTLKVNEINVETFKGVVDLSGFV
jgi:hypothetical protein